MGGWWDTWQRKKRETFEQTAEREMPTGMYSFYTWGTSQVCGLCKIFHTRDKSCPVHRGWFNLFSYVESAAVGLRMEPAAAKSFPQDWVVRLL